MHATGPSQSSHWLFYSAFIKDISHVCGERLPTSRFRFGEMTTNAMPAQQRRMVINARDADFKEAMRLK